MPRVQRGDRIDHRARHVAARVVALEPDEARRHAATAVDEGQEAQAARAQRHRHRQVDDSARIGQPEHASQPCDVGHRRRTVLHVEPLVLAAEVHDGGNVGLGLDHRRRSPRSRTRCRRPTPRGRALPRRSRSSRRAGRWRPSPRGCRRAGRTARLRRAAACRRPRRSAPAARRRAARGPRCPMHRRPPATTCPLRSTPARQCLHRWHRSRSRPSAESRDSPSRTAAGAPRRAARHRCPAARPRSRWAAPATACSRHPRTERRHGPVRANVHAHRRAGRSTPRPARPRVRCAHRAHRAPRRGPCSRWRGPRPRGRRAGGRRRAARGSGPRGSPSRPLRIPLQAAGRAAVAFGTRAMERPLPASRARAFRLLDPMSMPISMFGFMS